MDPNPLVKCIRMSKTTFHPYHRLAISKHPPTITLPAEQRTMRQAFFGHAQNMSQLHKPILTQSLF